MLEEEAGAVQAVAEQSAEEVGDGEEGKARREKMPALIASLRMTESNVRTSCHFSRISNYTSLPVPVSVR